MQELLHDLKIVAICSLNRVKRLSLINNGKLMNFLKQLLLTFI